MEGFLIFIIFFVATSMIAAGILMEVNGWKGLVLRIILLYGGIALFFWPFP